MKMRTIATLWLCLLLAVGLSGCFPESVNPLSTPEGSIQDKDLSGMWYGGPSDEEGDRIYLGFLPRDNNQTDIMALGFDNDDGSWMLMSMWATEIAGHRYMSLKFVSEDGEPIEDDDGYYFLCRYVIDEDGQLTVWNLATDPVTAEIKAGLPGDVSQGQWITSVTLTATTDELIEFLKTKDPLELFNEEIGVYERVN